MAQYNKKQMLLLYCREHGLFWKRWHDGDMYYMQVSNIVECRPGPPENALDRLYELFVHYLCNGTIDNLNNDEFWNLCYRARKVRFERWLNNGRRHPDYED